MVDKFLDVIKEYYDVRNLVWPSRTEAIQWLVTEVGEVCECDLALSGKDWVRNNPEKHQGNDSLSSLENELADVVFMALVTGIVCGLNPLRALLNKLASKARLTTIQHYHRCCWELARQGGARRGVVN